MKITRIRIYRPKKLNPTFNQSDMIVTIETDAGITGIGEGGTRDTLEQCAEMLIGESPERIQHLWQTMYRGYFYPAGREKLHALGALDLALWDIKGKTLNTPLYELLGGLTRNYVECYSTGYPWQGSLAETARACIESGFRAYRTAVEDVQGNIFNAREQVEATAAACREIREAIGPRGEWSIDFHTRLDLADAARLANLIEPQLIDYTRVTLPNTGGITELVKIAALAETHNIGLIPHFTGPVAVAALVHVLCSLPSPVLMEIGGSGPKMPPHLSQGVSFRDGKLWPEARPGLGVVFNPSGAELVSEVSQHSAPIPMYFRPDGSITNW